MSDLPYIASGIRIADYGNDGRIFYVDIYPDRCRRHPWVRWWWELCSYAEGDGFPSTHAYSKGGSGRTFTLRRALNAGYDAISRAILED